MPDITDAELAELQKARNLLKELYSDGSVGMDFRKIVKKKFPDAVIPELDAVAAAEKAGTDLEKKIGELSSGVEKKINDFLAARNKEREDADVANFEQRVKSVVKERGYTKEGEEGLIKLMKDKGINDPSDAAILFEAGQPKVKTKRSFSTRMPFISPESKDDEAFKRLMEDPDQFAADALVEAIEADASNQE